MTTEESDVKGNTSYQYDANGCLTSKISENGDACSYTYNLRKRLASANISRNENGQTVQINSNYVYDTKGNRVNVTSTVNGESRNRVFLIENLNHTDYAQVLEETSTIGGNPIKSYVIGDDILSQSVDGATSYMMYDGHGSTRLLADASGAITNTYDFDAYGMMIGGNPGVTNPAATDLLYSGEQYDCGLQMQYLRARYYDQNTGRFNALDPFSGNNHDPQSLHKYAYCHSDPVNGIDPSGEMTLLSFMFAMGTIAILARELLPVLTKIYLSTKNILNLRDTVLLIAKSPASLIEKLTIKNYIVRAAASEFRSLFEAFGEFGREVLFQVAAYMLFTAVFAAIIKLGSIGLGFLKNFAPKFIQLFKNSSNTSRVFWSGGGQAKDAAVQWAKANGATTLEMTFLGKFLDKITINATAYNFLEPLWIYASKSFAQGAQGTAHVFINMGKYRGQEFIWAGQEARILVEKGVEIVSHIF